MEKTYDAGLQAKLEQFLEKEGLSQAKVAPLIGTSQTALSQYRRSIYDKGDVAEMERKLREFFRIREEQAENSRKAEPFQGEQGYVPTSISEAAYKLIRYCQLEKGIVVIDGDAGIGKTEAAAKYLQDNPSGAVYVKASPSTGSVRSLLKLIARSLKLQENQRTEDLSAAIHGKLRQTEKVLIIDEAQNLKFMALEEIRGWVDKDIFTRKPGIGIVLIGNVEVYNRMLGRQESIFSQQFNRARLHGRYLTTDVRKEDVEKLLPVLKEKGMEEEIRYLHSVSRSKWGIRGMINVFNNAVNNGDITREGLEKVTASMGILLL